MIFRYLHLQRFDGRYVGTVPFTRQRALKYILHYKSVSVSDPM